MARAHEPIENQVDDLAMQVARRVLTTTRHVFAIVESSSNNRQIVWPECEPPSSISPSASDSDTSVSRSSASQRLRHSIQTRLPAGGLWCILDGFGSSDAIVRLRPTGETSAKKRDARKFALPAVAKFDDNTSPSTLEKLFGQLIAEGDERSLCTFLTELTSDFNWISFYVLRSDLTVLSTLLRHCELVFAAVDGKSPLSHAQSKLFKNWRRNGIPLQAAWLVAA